MGVIVAAALLAGGIVVMSILYCRVVEFSADGYTEQARLGNWILWAENYATTELLPFSVEAVATGDESTAYHIVLNLKRGEKRRGMAYWVQYKAQSKCDLLNQILLEEESAGPKKYAKLSRPPLSYSNSGPAIE